jgi:hypothetical protein
MFKITSIITSIVLAVAATGLFIASNGNDKLWYAGWPVLGAAIVFLAVGLTKKTPKTSA